MLRLGIDVGGTFTDFALTDTARGMSAIHKRLTTPDDPARAVIEGVAAVCAENGLTPGDLSEIVHGTTLVTNALLERRGARLGMLVTQGFRDCFDIGREQRYDLYDMRLRFAEPLVARSARAEISERMRHDGTAERALDTDQLRAAILDLVERERIDALAICYLHAYANPAHEMESRRIAAAMFPDIYISTSSEVFPQAREYERWTTTCANAYAQPLVDAYLGRLVEGLGAAGFAGHLAIIGSGGGLMTPQAAREFPVRLLESGPAAGVLMAARLARAGGIENLLSFDLGGTTAKGALVRRGRPLRSYEFEAAHAYHYRAGSGLQLQIPVVDMTEIGAGGGSIRAADTLGRLRVGPRSAGADPGPAAYGRGGQDATLTDANLMLGYLDAGFFLGGRMALDSGSAETALETLGDDLGLTARRAAWGVHDIANEDIARAFRMHATERGFDYRRATMAAFGGGGPLHAARIARKLRIPAVLFPAGAGVMSAFGMLSGALSFEVVRSAHRPLSDLTPESFAAFLSGIEAEAAAHLHRAGLPPGEVRLHRRLDMRYVGQGHDIEVALPDGDAETVFGALPALYEAAYRAVFDTTLPQPLEIMGWKVEASGPEPAESVPAAPVPVSAAGSSLKGHRRAWFEAAGGMIDCPVHDRYLLRPGDRVTGPCLIEERESTALLDVDDTGTVLDSGHILATIAGAKAAQPEGPAHE